MITRRSFALMAAAATAAAPPSSPAADEGDPGDVHGLDRARHVDPVLFAEPPRAFRQQAWLTYNLSKATEANMTEEVRRWAERDLAGSFYLGMNGGNTVGLSEEYLKGSNRKPTTEGIGFLSREYFDLYAKTIEAGLKAGIPPLVFYDEWGYPSGLAGGWLYTRYPQHAAKSLEKIERDIAGDGPVTLDIPEPGIPMGAVAWNRDTNELIDLSPELRGGRTLTWSAPGAARWKAMAFWLDPKASLGQGVKSGYCDYLDPEAVRVYIDLLYGSHYERLGKYFGTVLRIVQYDEPAMHVANGRMWTPRFNESFRREHGYDPMKYYPALWYDIGPDTAAVRNALWGHRAKLFSDSYIRQVDAWCSKHGLLYGGHLDQEEVANPVGVNGDIMLAQKYQAVPGIDDIWWWGRTNRGYKILSSAAFNWDKPIFMAETYAAYREMNESLVYKVAMDQAAMGVNFQVGALPKAKTPASDRFIGRVCYLLQHGRHVADIGILYPIASLQATYRFGDWNHASNAHSQNVAWAREGGPLAPEIDYIELGEQLFRGLRRDFTFLHPEVLRERCVVQGKKLVLNNPVNREEYSVLILPGGHALSLASARRMKQFYDAGGIVIATKALPAQSAEKGGDAELRRIADDVFGVPSDGPVRAQFNRRIDEFQVYFLNRNGAGGSAYFLPNYTPEMLAAIVAEAVPVPDIGLPEPRWPVVIGRAYAGSLTCIHKIKDGRDIYFFANSSEKPVETTVTLRGRHENLKLWDPMDGAVKPLAATASKHSTGADVTSVRLSLKPATAAFFVSEPGA